MTRTTTTGTSKTFSTKAVSYLIAKTKDRKVLEVMIQLQLKATFTKYLLSIRNCLALTWTPLILSTTLKGKCLHTHTHTQDRTWVWANPEKQWRSLDSLSSWGLKESDRLRNWTTMTTQRSLVGYSPGGRKDSDSTKWAHTHTHTHIYILKCHPWIYTVSYPQNSL